MLLMTNKKLLYILQLCQRSHPKRKKYAYRNDRLQEDTVDALLVGGANVNAVNVKKQTALHLAVMKKQVYNIKLIVTLLQHGADVYALDEDGNDAFYYACRGYFLDIAKKLLEAKISKKQS